jgi:hypothetical protein
MKYKLMMRSRPDPGERIADKHNRFLDALARMPKPWGASSKVRPQAGEPGSSFATYVDLTKLFHLRARARYANRWYLRDTAEHDDYFTLEFNPEKVEGYASLALVGVERLIAGFNAYYLEIKDERFTHKYFDAWRKTGYDDRDGVSRLSLVNYFDAELCRRAFGLTPRQVCGRLSKLDRTPRRTVLHTCEFRGGVHVALHPDPLPFEQADRLCRDARRLLPRGPKHRRKPWRPPPKKERFAAFAEVVPKLAHGAVRRVAPAGAMNDPRLAHLVLDYSSESVRTIDRFLQALEKRRSRFTTSQWGEVLRWRSGYVHEAMQRSTFAEYGGVSPDQL